MESFPQILFSAWESKITGRLLVKNDATEKTLTFIAGNIAVDKDVFEDKAFLKYLLQKKILDNPSAKKCEALTTKKKTSFLAAILDLRILSPQHLWKNMEVYAKQEVLPFFDLSPLTSSLVSEKKPPQHLHTFHTPHSRPYPRRHLPNGEYQTCRCSHPEGYRRSTSTRARS